MVEEVSRVKDAIAHRRRSLISAIALLKLVFQFTYKVEVHSRSCSLWKFKLCKIKLYTVFLTMFRALCH